MSRSKSSLAASAVAITSGVVEPGQSGQGRGPDPGEVMPSSSDEGGDPDGVEDQPVGESASMQVRADRVNGGLNVR